MGGRSRPRGYLSGSMPSVGPSVAIDAGVFPVPSNGTHNTVNVPSSNPTLEPALVATNREAVGSGFQKLLQIL